MNIRIAQQQDVIQIVELLNTAYRTNLGWTNEAEYIKGERIQVHQLEQLLKRKQYQLFVYESENKIQACIALDFNPMHVEIGSFAVHPKYQNQGFGKQLLVYVENLIQNEYRHLKLIMSVINVRTELIEYYLRRGYKNMGITQEYPTEANVGVPIVPLHLVILEKSVISN